MLMWHFLMPNKICYYYFNGHVSFQCANSALRLPRRLFFVSEMTVGTKMERFFILGTKSGKNKIQGPKWESLENVISAKNKSIVWVMSQDKNAKKEEVDT